MSGMLRTGHDFSAPALFIVLFSLEGTRLENRAELEVENPKQSRARRRSVRDVNISAPAWRRLSAFCFLCAISNFSCLSFNLCKLFAGHESPSHSPRNSARIDLK